MNEYVFAVSKGEVGSGSCVSSRQENNNPKMKIMMSQSANNSAETVSLFFQRQLETGDSGKSRYSNLECLKT